MPNAYPVKRVLRNWKLFTALLIGIALASTFFACIDVKANSSATTSLNQQLKSITVDMQFNTNLNLTEVTQTQGNISSINGVSSVDVVYRFNYPVKDLETNFTDYPEIACLPESSSINREWTNGPVYIGANQTYVLAGTLLASKVHIGDNITTELMFPTPNQGNWTTIYLNFTVAGFADFTEKGYQLLSGNTYEISPYQPPSSVQTYEYPQDLMLIGWNSTLLRFWSGMANRTVDTTFLINTNNDKIISPWNVQTSINNVNVIANDIQNKLLSNYQQESFVQNNLDNALENFNFNFQSTLTQFILFSIPVFFISWYLGSTVSDVSFNMRRREIGLLSTKGLSSGQIQRMFLGEAITIGVIGGAVGVIGGLVLNQVFNGGFNVNTLFSPQAISPVTMVFTVIFGMILALLSVFLSARKASRLPTVEALREYSPSWAFRGSLKIPAWIALGLGTYQLIIVFFGINVVSLVNNANSGEFFTNILLAPVTILNGILTYIGPLLFFWGLTKILIQNSSVFQRALTRISRVLGDFGALAAKNVRRSPARIAAIAFIIALIIGYGVQVNGQIASQQDYLVRQVKYQVGGDISVGVVNATKATQVLSEILGNVSGIQSSTMQCQLSQNYAGTTIRTIDPTSWLKTAYYENGWFSGASMQQAFTEMENNNQTIILEQRVAQELNLKVGDTLAIDFASGARTLTIVGLFGPKLPSNELPSGTGGSITVIGSGGPTDLQFYSPYLITWSYVPRNLFNMSSSFSDAFKDENFDTTILLKLDSGVNGTAVADKIRSLNLEIEGVTSFAEEWQQTQQGSQTVSTENGLNPVYTMQVLDFQSLGIAFAILSASVGMVLIAVVSLSERSREATIMSVRGLSYRQLVWMFLAENLAVITFAVILGLVVGLMIDYGTINSGNAGLIQLVLPHFVYPASALETVAWYIGLIYASTIGAILVMTRRYVTNLERMVRLK
ncbi:MAG: FtsX-like permease family protein [Candidatus Bathyarchaeia archaeon]